MVLELIMCSDYIVKNVVPVYSALYIIFSDCILLQQCAYS